MTASTKRIMTAVAWGLAFGSVVEIVMAAGLGGWSGWHFGKGHDPDEVIAAGDKAYYPLMQILQPLAEIIGLSLGLLGRLPGTEKPLE